MTKNYTSTLQGLDLDRYVKKLQCLSLCGRSGWVSQTCQLSQASTFISFPALNGMMTYCYGHLWTFQACVHTSLRYTLEKLKAYRSLEAYTIIRGLLP